VKVVGTEIHIPKQSKPVFDATVDFNTANPNTGGTVFTPNTPALTTVLYVSAVDGTQWTYNGTTYVPEPQIDLYRDRGMPNTLMTLSGVATFSRTNFLKWTNKFFILGGGRGAGTLSTAGYYEIGMPSVGTVIQGVGGIPNQTVSASGIDMRASGGSWSVLYYILNAGGQATVNANFRLAGWQSNFVVPNNWVMVGAYNADNLTVKLGNGQILKQGTDTNGLITPFDATIDFGGNTNPNTAGTTFNPSTPANSNVVYISTINGSQWSWNGIAYIAEPISIDWRIAGNVGTVQATNFVGTTDNVGLSLRTNNVIRQTISNTGNVGIGTTTPTNRLHVPNSGFNPNGNDLASIKVEGGYGGGIAFAEGANRSLIWSDSGRSLSFSTGGTITGTPERMRILFNGNVGINTVGPSEKLEVGGNIRVTGIPNFANAAAALASGLLSGVFYTITVGGVKQLFIK
jgi:hypothetical protein